MKKIVVPVDFSDISKYGTELAVKIAKHIDATIHFLNIVTLPSHILLTQDGDIFEDGDFDVSVPRKLKEDNQIRLKEWAAQYAPDAKLCVCFGHVNEQVMKYADELHADLIVMGTHINMGVKELLNASHAQYIAMHTAIPIMTLKCDRSDLQVKSIVLASSFKIADVPHCEMALALQKAFNAKLYLLRVNTSDDFLPDGEVEKHMKAFAAKYQLQDFEMAIYNDNEVEDGIMHFVAKHDIDIIAIGSKQRTGINKIINGCVSADVLNHLYKPILTFKLKD
jgi:nucleotide-binding universal stress UspA family protein